MQKTKPVKIYFKPTCGYSQRALSLLQSKEGINLEKLDITDNSALKEEMMKKTGGRTSVPQIFIAGEHIGGCDELYMLESSQALDKKLYD